MTDGLFVTFRLGVQWFGVPVLGVQEVLTSGRVTPVPLAPPSIAGLLNLRGHIITAIDLHRELLVPGGADSGAMTVVVHDGDELFALLVDEVGDVVSVERDAIEPLPAALSTSWGRTCVGVLRREHDLLAVLDTAQLLDAPSPTTASVPFPRAAA